MKNYKDYMRWHKRTNGRGKIVMGTLAGIAAGLTAGFLTAPRSGKETRTIITTRAADTIDKVGSNFEKTKEDVIVGSQETLEKGREEIEKARRDLK